MDLLTLAPFGMRVTGLRVGPLDAQVADALARLLGEHGVLVLPAQHDVGDDAFVSFLASFGELTFTQGETPVVGHPDLNVVSNVGRTTPPRSTFHVDTSYVSHPPAYTALRAVQVPAQGGQTVFSDQYRAFETLPPDLLELLSGRSIRHVVTGVKLDDGDQGEAEHPVLRVHPLTGRTSLYLTSPARCAAITGLSEQETAETVALLLEHSTRPDNLYRHAWSAGDVVMWDNGCVLHRADHEGVVGDRVMHRGMSLGYALAGRHAG